MSKKPEWAEALDRLLSQRVEAVPPGWKTAQEVGEQLGVCYEMAKIKCKRLVQAGMAERADFRVKWGKGIRSAPHYRLFTGPVRGRKPE